MFTFDYVANENTSQADIFERMAKPIADSCLQGYNGTIFAYGQTGSGKTFTIQGPAFTSASGEEQIISNLNSSGQIFEGRGLMQRSFEHIFQSMENERQEAEKNGSEVKYLVKTSYLEIYNEQILDLLDPSQTNLHIREDIKTGVYVEGLVEEPVQSVKDMIALITRGSRNRHVGSTNMNKESSRSHSVLTTQIESKCMTASGVWQMRSSCFHIIDLAGSERSKQTNAEGQRLKEAGMINKSLSALGIVINSLVEISEGRTRHVHYRDSKLTFLLRDSLGGNSKTVIIANITQAATSASETLSTLKFAQRAKLIKNKAVINEESSGTIALLKTEIKRLKQEIIEISNDKLQIEQRLLGQGDITSRLCAICMEENSVKNEQNQPSPDEMLIEENYRSKSSTTNFDQKKYQERVAYLEKLLSANLDNFTSSQKYYEAEMAKKAQSIKWFQKAIDSFEKQSQQDKMIIKFRDQRIQKLEQALANSDTSKCRSCEVSSDQITQLTEERDNWRDQFEKQASAQAAKLFAEKSQLIILKESLEKELKQTPDSLQAQIRSLNELNDNLNQYLKDHCEQIAQDNVTFTELQTLKNRLQEENDSLNMQLSQQSAEAEKELELLKTQHQKELSEFQERISQMYDRHSAEKALIQREATEQIDQIKRELQSVSQGTEFQFTRLKIEAIEKNNELQLIIDAKDKQLHAREESLAQLDLTSRQLREAIEKSTLSHLQTTDELQLRISMLQNNLQQERETNNQKIKQLRDEHKKELTQIQKDLLVEQSQGDFLREQDTEQKKRIFDLEAANEDLQKQLILGFETIQELRSQIKQIELKLQSQNKENQQKVLLAQSQELQWREHSQMMSKKAAETEKVLTQEFQEYRQTKEKQIQELNQYMEQLQQSSKEQVDQLQNNLRAQSTLYAEEKIKLDQKYDQLQQQLQNQITETELKFKILSSQFDDYRQKSEVQHKKQTDIQKEAETNFQQQVLELQNTLLIRQDEVNQLTERVRDLLKQQIEIQSLLDSKQIQVEAAQTEIQKITSVSKEQELQLQRTVQDLLNAKELLQNQLLDQKSAFQFQQQQATDNFQKQVEQYKDQISQHENYLQALQNQQINQKADFEVQKQKTLNQLKLVEVENQEFQEQIFNLKQQNEQIQKQYQYKLEKIELNLKQALDNDRKVQAQQTAIVLEEQLALKEKEIKSCMIKTYQSQLQEQQRIHEIEIQNQKNRAAKKLKSTCITLIDSIRQLKVDYAALKRDVTRNLKWEFIQPSQAEVLKYVQSQIQSRTEKEGKHIWEVQSLKALHQKALQAQQAIQIELKQNVSDLNEQLNEYKGLTAQLQVEKQTTIQNMETISEKLRVSTFALGELKQAKEECEFKLKQEKIQQLNEKESQIQALQTELDNLRNNLMQKTVDLTKIRSKLQDSQAQIQQNKDTINDLLNKEGSMMDDVQSRISSVISETELWKKKVADQKQEISDLKKSRDQITQKYDIVVAQSKELILARDYENETKQTVDRQKQQEVDALKAEIQQQQHSIQKQDLEIKEVVKLLKKYSDENKQLQWENEQLRQQNEMQSGHQNLQQKIQHHQKIKEENNKLRVENYNLKEDLRKKFEQFGNTASQSQRQNNSDQELERVRKDCATISQNIDQVVEYLTKMPGVAHYLKMMPQLSEQIKKSSQPASSSYQAAFNSQQKSNVAVELIGYLGRQLQQQINQQQSEGVLIQSNLQKPQLPNGQQRAGSSSGLRQVDTSKRVGTLYLNPSKGQNHFQ